MGYYVSTLHNIPSGKLSYFIHVMGPETEQKKWINENLATLGAALGVKAGLISGSEYLTREVLECMRALMGSQYKKLRHVLEQQPFLLITEGPLTERPKGLYCFDLHLSSDRERNLELTKELFPAMANAFAKGEFKELMQALDAKSVKIEQYKDRAIPEAFRVLNECLILQPNIGGFGVNLNAVIERFTR